MVKLHSLRFSSRLRAFILGFALVHCIDTASAYAADYYVAPNGSPRNNGSINSPLDLATALGSLTPARPGDTIWLRNGRYLGNFVSYLTGTPSAPIIVRQYPGERATIDADTSQRTTPALTVNGSDTWYWGFEITDSNPVRMVTGGYNPPRGTSVWVLGARTKFINLIVHDGEQGFGYWSTAVDSELYGNLIYNTGFDSDDRGHGHGIYVQNATGTKRIVDNIMFNGFSFGIHAYTQGGRTDNIHMIGNTILNYGVLSRRSGPKANLYMGGVDSQFPLVQENYIYFSPFTSGGRNLDLQPSCINGRILNNYSAGGTAMSVFCVGTTMTGNFFAGRTITDVPTAGNTIQSTVPTGVKVFVRPNQYERGGRANITIFNWSLQSHVTVDLSGAGFAVGTPYELRDAQNYFGAPVVTGTYNGQPITVPMLGLSAVPPVGNVPIVPPHTAPQFGAFILVKTSNTAPPTAPTASLSASPASITTGQSTMLSWSTANATQVTIDNGIGVVPASGTASVSPSATTTYTLTASNQTTSVMKSAAVTVNPGTTNRAPTVNLATPGTTFTAPATITLTATASDVDGSVSSVRFYNGATLLATDTSNTYSHTWTSVPAGTYDLTAQATDNTGASTTSAVIRVTVGSGKPTAASATFLQTDKTTQGNWKGVYGAQGYRIADDATSVPGWATVTPTGHLSWTWSPTTGDTRALQRTTTGRVAAAMYATSWNVDLAFADGLPHEVAFYVLDWDRDARAQLFELIDAATGATLDRQSASGFEGGQYLVWRVTGNVRVKVTRQAGYNAVISGIFIDAAPLGSTQASFVRSDSTTQGNWKGTYGKAAYAIANDATSFPTSLTLALGGSAPWTWTSSTADTRALERGGAGRLASTWYGQRFTLNVGLVDGRSHQVALHVLDWDRNNRSQSVEVADAVTGAVLDRRTVADFSGGQYLVWQVTGNVTFTVTKVTGHNAVVGGVFVDRRVRRLRLRTVVQQRAATTLRRIIRRSELPAARAGTPVEDPAADMRRW